MLNLGLVAGRHNAGATLDLEARVSRAVSAFAHGEALWDWDRRSWDYTALGGLRVRWPLPQ